MRGITWERGINHYVLNDVVVVMLNGQPQGLEHHQRGIQTWIDRELHPTMKAVKASLCIVVIMSVEIVVTRGFGQYRVSPILKGQRDHRVGRPGLELSWYHTLFFAV